MKKTKLIKIALVSASITSLAVVPFMVSHNDISKSEKALFMKNAVATGAATNTVTAHPTHEQPTTNIVDPKNAINFWEFGKKEEEIDPTVWRAKPQMKKFKNAFMEQWVSTAKKEGWRSVDEYQMYLQYKIETNGPTGYDTFAGASTPDENWLAWHKAQGGNLWSSYVAGTGSPICPTWVGAENESWNDIDNTINWYQYDSAGKQFIFDENNIENAWKRLIFMNKLIPTSEAEVRNEVSSEKGADGNAISDTNPAVQRNKYMIDGELLNDLPTGFHKYYYVKYDSDFVRDDNGWKIIVTDRNKKENLSKILNPANQANAGTKQADGSYTGGKWKVYNSEKGTININVINYDEGTVYTKNPDHDRNVFYSQDGNAKDNKSPEAHWTGKFSIVHKEDNFTKLVNYPHTWFPQELRVSKRPLDRFGQVASESFTHPWNGGGYGFVWVEDGLGGHKFYKSLTKLKQQVIKWRREHANELEPNTLSEDLIFYGNWNHVFPKKEWYEELSDIYADTGL